jgi:hypothetical protein
MSNRDELRPATRDLGVQFAPLRACFIIGTLLSCLGFALPWFRISRSYEWYYGGWGMVTTNEPGLWWISFLFLGYLILLLAGYWLLRLDSLSAGLLASLAIAVALGTLVVVGLAAADAVQEQGRVYRLDLNVGLFLMLPGHGLLVVSALGGFVVQLVKELLPVRQVATPGATQEIAGTNAGRRP